MERGLCEELFFKNGVIQKSPVPPDYRQYVKRRLNVRLMLKQRFVLAGIILLETGESC